MDGIHKQRRVGFCSISTITSHGYPASRSSLRHCASQSVWTSQYLCFSRVSNLHTLYLTLSLNCSQFNSLFHTWANLIIFSSFYQRIKKTLRLLLTSDDGYLYIYGMDIQEGGDCHLIRQFYLTNATEAGITEAELARQVNENCNMSWW